jgi:hypothetical protein
LTAVAQMRRHAKGLQLRLEAFCVCEVLCFAARLGVYRYELSALVPRSKTASASWRWRSSDAQSVVCLVQPAGGEDAASLPRARLAGWRTRTSRSRGRPGRPARASWADGSGCEACCGRDGSLPGWLRLRWTDTSGTACIHLRGADELPRALKIAGKTHSSRVCPAFSTGNHPNSGTKVILSRNKHNHSCVSYAGVEWVRWGRAARRDREFPGRCVLSNWEEGRRLPVGRVDSRASASGFSDGETAVGIPAAGQRNHRLEEEQNAATKAAAFLQRVRRSYHCKRAEISISRGVSKNPVLFLLVMVPNEDW